MNNTENSGRIFKAAEPIKDVLAALDAKRKNPNDPLAKSYVDDSYMRGIYRAAMTRLGKSDIVSVDEMALRLTMSQAEYIQLANAGQALLIEVHGKQFVPLCQIGADGKIDDLKLDIAREFAVEGKSYFKFMDYFGFMTRSSANISKFFSTKRLKTMFATAGLGDFECSLSVMASPNQLADQRRDHPGFFKVLVKNLDQALTKGGWDPSGGLSRQFRDKYKIPGLTLDEQHMPPPNSKKPSP